MACFNPISAFYGEDGGLVFVHHLSKYGITINLPCGKCSGCRLAQSRDWAIRCIHEAQMHEDNVFLTLTYNDDHLPKNRSLDKTHFQKFIRSLRQKTGVKIRYYMCGEYGDKTQRPHYHAILFGYKFPDSTLWQERRGNKVYRSKLLESTWFHGNSEIGNVTFKSAGYVARYVMKKITGDLADDHYEGREPEYNSMSLKPGIGQTWFEEYASDVFPADKVVLPNGTEVSVPKFYRKKLKEIDPKLYSKLKVRRQKEIYKNSKQPNPELRTKAKQFNHEQRLQKLIRTHE